MKSSAITIIPSLQDVEIILRSLQAPSLLECIAIVFCSLVATAFYSHGKLWDRPDPKTSIYYERPQQQEGAANGAPKAQRNISKKLDEAGKRMVVFWGSQSGTAERFAEQLAKECTSRFGLDTIPADLSDYDPESIADLTTDQLAIFIISTYGEGDPSDNTAGFWEWIHKSQNISLSNLRYAAFGLGNSNYKYFNRVIDVVVDACTKSGASQLLSVGKADDANGGTEEDFLAWKEDLFKVLQQELHLEEKQIAYEPTLTVQEDESLEPIDLHQGEPTHPRDNPKSAAACSAISAMSIKSCSELFKSPDRNCLHMELDLSEHAQVHYKTGDHLAVWPSNPDEEVEILLTALDLSARRNIPISLKSEQKIKIPSPTTTAVLFRHYLEICAPVSRRVVTELAAFAPTPESKSHLLSLGQDKDQYATYISSTHLTLGRLLKLTSHSTPWTNLPLAYIIENIPVLQPRYYSISSSSVLSPRRPTITALVSNKALAGTSASSIPGLTTNYLLALSKRHSTTPTPVKTISSLSYNLQGPANILQGSKLFAHVRKSKFKLPTMSSTPIIMVAAGTGLAPFRAFIAERAKLASIGKPVGQMILFFGCRHPDEDYIYRSELEGFQSTLGSTLKIVTAFSRVEREGRIYVQNRVSECGEEVLGLLDAGASFYICGRASMAREVGRSVSESAKKAKGWADEEAKQWSEGLKKRGKWREDVWG